MATKQDTLSLMVMVMLISLVLVYASSKPILKRKESFSIIRELNREGPYVGLITVYPPEEEAFFLTRAFKPHPRHPFVDLSGRRFRVGKIQGKSVVYVRCGIGMMNAAATTQQMVDLFDVSGIVHFGIAGNVNNSLSIGDVTIPSKFAHTGIWDWLNPNGTLPANDIAHLDIKNYNTHKGEETNLLGIIGYSTEEFYSQTGEPNVPRRVMWAETSQHWLRLATKLKDMELKRCVNSSMCLRHKPKVEIGLRGSTANIFVDNAAYRNFLFQTFQVSSVDMESVAVVMTSLSNGFPVIVIRGLSDLAGRQSGKNVIDVYGPLAAINAAKVVIQFIKKLPRDMAGV